MYLTSSGLTVPVAFSGFISVTSAFIKWSFTILSKTLTLLEVTSSPV